MTWRILVRSMAHGRPVIASQVSNDFDVRAALRLGFITRVKPAYRGSPALYRVTNLGREWLEGRVDIARRRPGGEYAVATWLRALPAGLRVTPGRCPYCGGT